MRHRLVRNKKGEIQVQVHEAGPKDNADDASWKTLELNTLPLYKETENGAFTLEREVFRKDAKN